MPQAPAKPLPPVPPAEFREADIATMPAPALLAIVKDAAAPEFKKAKACVRLGELGAKEAIPVLATLLARSGLEPLAGPEADDALRAAMPKLKGNHLIGVINSLGKRRDPKAIPALAKLLSGPDPETARAAAAALGSIGGPQAQKDLQSALPKTNGLVKLAVADAILICAERYLADGKRAEALALFASMSAAEIPKPMRLAAMNAIIREETSATRPR
jgi:HEAT repeat protein